jgi:polar amino acid transport system substrate-binding protein
MSCRLSRSVATGLALTTVLVLTACVSGSGRPDPTSASPLAPWTDAVMGSDPGATTSEGPTPTPPPTATASPSAAGCGNPVASFAPPSPMPGPGAMPAGSYMAAIAEHGRLVVGVSADTLLFGARNPLTGRIEGFDIDMLKAASKAIFGKDVPLEYKVITYAQRIPSLQDHSVDVVAHTMTINCKRWGLINFTAEYFHAGQKVLVASTSKATGIKDLDGARVCAAKGSTNIDNLAAYPRVVVVGVDDLTDCLVAFQQGSVDAITADDTVLAGFAAQDPYAKVVGKAFTDEPYGLGVAKEHPEFAAFLNGVLAQVVSTGQWRTSYSTWLGTAAAVPSPPRPAYGRAS